MSDPSTPDDTTEPPTNEPSDTTDRSSPSTADLHCICRLDGVLDLLSRQYAMQVICAVGALQPARYGEVEDALADVSTSTLSARLEELTDAGLLAREQYDEIPPRVEYELTDDGAELAVLLVPVLEWAEERAVD